MTDQNPLNGWHLDKRVSLGHLVTTIVVAASIVIWMMSLEKRVDLNTQAIRYNTSQIERNNADIKERLDAVIIMLRRLEDKLERPN